MLAFNVFDALLLEMDDSFWGLANFKEGTVLNLRNQDSLLYSHVKDSIFPTSRLAQGQRNENYITNEKSQERAKVFLICRHSNTIFHFPLLSNLNILRVKQKEKLLH